jgi:hypothetical protein
MATVTEDQLGEDDREILELKRHECEAVFRRFDALGCPWMMMYRRSYPDYVLDREVTVDFKVRDGDEVRLATVDEVLANQARHVWFSELEDDRPPVRSTVGAEAPTPVPTPESAAADDEPLTFDDTRFHHGTVKKTERKELLVEVSRFTADERDYMVEVARSFHDAGHTVLWIGSRDGDKFHFGLDLAGERRRRDREQDDADHGRWPESSYGVVTNAKTIEEIDPIKGEVVERHEPYTLRELRNVLRERLFDWPRRVGKLLFVPDKGGIVHYLEQPDQLTSWLARFGHVELHNMRGCVSKSEFYHELVRSAPEYDSVERIIHEPKMPGAYYSCRDVVPGDGRALDGFLDFFNPQTDCDRELLRGATVTPFWGGPPGLRPAMLIKGMGPGTGKTEVAEKIGDLAGGTFGISPNESVEIMRQRLLTPAALQYRVSLVDNITDKFAWPDWDSLLTAAFINGKQLYVGDSRRPNLMSWFLTTNDQNLSADASQRVVPISLAMPTYSDDWEDRIQSYINERREQVIADIVGVLRRPAVKLVRYTRWAPWERGVLSKLKNPDALLSLIEDRRRSANVENDELGIVISTFAEQLEINKGFFARDLGMHRQDVDLSLFRVFIPSRIAADWLCRALNKPLPTVTACRLLDKWTTEGRFGGTEGTHGGRLVGRNSSKKIGRGFIWFGSQAVPQSTLLKSLANIYGSSDQTSDSSVGD